jgi:Flp pilus assembly protein TadG
MIRRVRSKLDRRGIAVFLTVAMSVAIFPMAGLGLDAAILYVVKTQLSSAADAAALAAARSLSRGVDFNTQKAAAQQTSQDYFRANFPLGYFMSTSSSVNTDVTLLGNNTRVVTTTATAQVPLFFMRMLPNAPPSGTINVSAVANRRDSNVVLVLDRSYSMKQSSSCAPMTAAAAGFVDKFAEQRDYLGLVTFASSSYYMDYPIATNFKSSSPTLGSIINSINCDAGATNSAQGLWNGYTALANLNQPGALNVIVFFTDGDPTAFPGTFNIKATSSCTNKGSRTAVLTMTTAPNAYGLLKLSNGPVPIANDNATLTGDNSCAWSSNAGNVANDISAIPAADYFSDNTNTGYAGAVTLALANGGTNSTNATSIQNASINVAVEAAKHIRNGDAVTAVIPGAPAAAVGKRLSNVVIFSIGLGNAGTPPNAAFLKKVANTSDAVGYDSTQQTGLYVAAQTAADLQDAFERVAAEVLRLAR